MVGASLQPCMIPSPRPHEHFCRKRHCPLVVINEGPISTRGSTASLAGILKRFNGQPWEITIKNTTDGGIPLLRELHVRFLALQDYTSYDEATFLQKYRQLVEALDQTYPIPESFNADLALSSHRQFMKESSLAINEELVVNDMTTFDHPLSCIHVINSEDSNLVESFHTLFSHFNEHTLIALEYVSKAIAHGVVFVTQSSFEDISKEQEIDQTISYISKEFPGIHCYKLFVDPSTIHQKEEPHSASFDPIKHFVGSFLMQHLVPFALRIIQEGLPKATTSGTTTLGFASKFFSMSKKYLPTGGLFKQEALSISNTFVPTVFSSTSAELISRRIGDLYFMLGFYKEALAIYEMLLETFQETRAMAHYHSAQEWCLYSRVHMDSGLKLAAKIIDNAVQFYLSHRKFHFNALRILAMTSLCSDIILKNVSFMLCSRFSQSAIESIFKLAPLTEQAWISLSIKRPKQRIALLLFNLAGSVAESNNLINFAIGYTWMALDPIFSSSPNDLLHLNRLKLCFLLERRKLLASKKISLIRTLLECPTILTTRDLSFCLTVLKENLSVMDSPLSLSHVICESLSLNSNASNGQSKGMEISDSLFTPIDYPLFEKYSETIFNIRGKFLDSMELFLTNEEQTMQTNETFQICANFHNTLPFPIKLSEFAMEVSEFDATITCSTKTSNQFNFKADTLAIPPTSIGAIVFDLMIPSEGKYYVNKIECRLDGSIPLVFLITMKGFRLNLKKKQRLEPFYAENHRKILNVVDKEMTIDAGFEIDDGSSSLRNEVGRVQLKLFNPHEHEGMQFTVVYLKGQLQPDNGACQSTSRQVDVYRVPPKTTTTVNFIPMDLDPDYVIGVNCVCGETVWNRILRRRFSLLPIFRIESVVFRGLEGPKDAVLLVELKCMWFETVHVDSAQLIAGAKILRSTGLGSFEVGPDQSFCIPFVENFACVSPATDAYLELQLSDRKRLRFPVSWPPNDVGGVRVKLGQRVGHKALGRPLLIQSEISGLRPGASLADSHLSQSMWLGDIRLSSPSDHYTSFAYGGNGGYIYLGAPRDEKQASRGGHHTFDLIVA